MNRTQARLDAIEEVWKTFDLVAPVTRERVFPEQGIAHVCEWEPCENCGDMHLTSVGVYVIE